MDDPRYSQDPTYEYDNYEPYDEYSPQEVTNMGLPPGQLALIIGVNAVIALIISLAVVLIAGRGATTGDEAVVVTESDETTTEVSGDVPTVGGDEETGGSQVEGEGAAAVEAAAEATPVESVTYTVEPNDTLSSIAAKFSVPVFDLMVVNGLSDADFIQAGQQLTIPLSGVPTATPTFTVVPQPTETPLPFDPPTSIPTEVALPQEPAATVGPSPTPTDTPEASPTPIPTLTPPSVDEIEVVVNEILSPGDLERETVVILNRGAGISLRDWTLEGSALGIFQFPDVFLFSGGSIRIHTAAGQNTASDLYLSQGQAAWQPGDIVILNDNKNTEINRFEIATE